MYYHIMNKLQCVDLFSGIGGISLATFDFATVIQYCEKNLYCQEVLHARMQDGKLDRAPIHSDVKRLHIPHVLKPTMICGGFPCQDISTIGLQRGITHGKRSGLFFEIVRILDETPSIEVVFLENVRNILSCGMKEVVEELVKRGFSLQWILKSASSQGAPHVRCRWFCLACRQDTDLTRFQPLVEQNLAETTNQWWENEPARRLCLKPSVRSSQGPDADEFDTNWIYRCGTLGNTVVPSVVREAFIELIRSQMHWKDTENFIKHYGVDINVPENIPETFPESGIILDGYWMSLPKRMPAEKKHSVNIDISFNAKMVSLDYYPTPRCGMTHGSTLSDRSLKDLPTVLIQSEKSLEYLRQIGIQLDDPSKVFNYAVANARYVEWMMGYEQDWTKIKEDPDSAHKFGRVRKIQPSGPVDVGEGGEGDEGDEGHEAEVDARVKRKVKVNDKVIGRIRWNGMHMFMREHPKNDVRSIAKLWKALPVDKRARFTVLAKQASLKEFQRQQEKTS